MTITKAGQDMLLERMRQTPNVKMEYTMDGPIHSAVVSCVKAEMQRDFLYGERAMQKALQDLRHEQAFSKLNGLAKAQFNHQKEEIEL